MPVTLVNIACNTFIPGFIRTCMDGYNLLRTVVVGVKVPMPEQLAQRRKPCGYSRFWAYSLQKKKKKKVYYAVGTVVQPLGMTF